jgi:hypothetical protein
MIAQCSITAALAWLLARQLLGHQLPFFAPIAAIINLASVAQPILSDGLTGRGERRLTSSNGQVQTIPRWL